MTVIEKLQNKFTLLVEKNGGIIFSSSKKGIVPLLELLDKNPDLKGAAAIDKIVGKAAALLYSLTEISEVNAGTMSVAACEILGNNNIRYTFECLTNKIINRRGDGLCPMEQAVKDIDSPEAALEAVKKKLSELNNK